MLNRANRRDTIFPIFQKDADFEAFESVLKEALDRGDLLLYSCWVMPNHWHLVVGPQVDGEMGRFGQWVTLTHTRITAQAAKDISTKVAISRCLFKTMAISARYADMSNGMLTPRNCAKSSTSGVTAAFGVGFKALPSRSESLALGQFPDGGDGGSG